MSLSASQPLWDFAVAVYARPGVRELCLRLQDDHGFDVDVLLTAAWAAHQGLRLDAEAAGALDEAARPVRERFTIPIRALRRAAAHDPELKQHLLAAELRAERLAIQALHTALPRVSTPGASVAENLAACAPGNPLACDLAILLAGR